ncbi:BTB/POZ domain-containing protein 6-like isoform X3 [Cyprinodon tularosa]|uniref:BTB/POZ domain-containing protein 6-like isoform X3 n=1 Tax=Cyprinodon tularosa TaxID=77115 RepID=UPI0018E25FEA|nr:BTB/POZ domain-containing protein 6-like isoform X3 [Cyprinodon tularosa]
MPTAHCGFFHHGRIMRCLTYLLLLPETLKKPKKLQESCEILTLSSSSAQKGNKTTKMAAELFSAANPDNTASANGTAVPVVEKTNAAVCPARSGGAAFSSTGGSSSAARDPSSPLNISNNKTDPASSSGHPTLRERYLYSDEIDLDADTVLATLYAAKKYIVPALAKACVTFLETSLEAKNACVLLSQSCLFEEPELTQRCWEVIDAQAEMALRSDGFCDIDRQTLELILQRETLNTEEVVVFEAVMNWAAAECRRRGLGPSTHNKRDVLGRALFLVRIPTLSVEEFANTVAQSDILTLKETHNVFLWYTASKKPVLDFPLTPRQGLSPQRCHRFQSSAYRSNQWRYRGRCDSIQFAVDKRIFIAGLGMYGSSGGRAEYNVKIELKRQGAVLAQSISKFVSDGSSSTFPVWFDHPVQVEQDTFYTVSAVLDGNELSYFGQEGMTEVQCGKVTFQFQCSSDSTNGTGVQGGQIPELVFYA